MNLAEYAYGPLRPILQEILSDRPPTDPTVLRVILGRCLQGVIELQESRERASATPTVPTLASRSRDDTGPAAVCAQAYQVVGCLLHDLGVFGTERADKILDNLSEGRIVHDDVLPWNSLTPGAGAGEAIGRIAAEYRRQIEAEGFTPQLDDVANARGEMACAAALYAIPAELRSDGPAGLWPWAREWWKPTPDDRVRELTKAGALIVAEIGRLLRAAQS